MNYNKFVLVIKFCFSFCFEPVTEISNINYAPIEKTDEEAAVINEMMER
jgi:ketopantoate reductase